MSDPNVRQWRDLEEEMEELAALLPPADGVIKDITPWRRSLNRVLIGVLMTTVTFHMLQLQYILPTAGLILIMLGFRGMRRESRWFDTAWKSSVVRLGVSLGPLIINATLWQKQFHESWIGKGIPYVSGLLMAIQLLCLWRGICQVKGKTGLLAKSNAGAMLFVWYLLLMVLAIGEIQSDVTFWMLLIVHGCILWSLYQLSAELESSGYALISDQTKWGDGQICAVVAVILAVGMSVGYLCIHQYPMEWTVVDQKEATQVEMVKAELHAMGFPEKILEDLTQQEILDCRGARQVFVKEESYPFNEGRNVTVTQGKTTKQVTVYDVEELQLSCVIVARSEPDQWRIFYHFSWEEDPGQYGTEAIQLWPPTAATNHWVQEGELSGRLLYNEGDTVYQAPFHSLGIYRRNALPFFEEDGEYYDRVATFSLPAGKERCRGYIVMDLRLTESPVPLSSNLAYVHQTSWRRYPVRTTVEAFFGSRHDNTQKVAVHSFSLFVKDGTVRELWDR